MNRLIAILLFCVLVSFTGNEVSLQYSADIAKVYNTYGLAENYACAIDVNIFNSSKLSKPSESIHALQRKKGSDYYSELGNIVNLMNKKYVITVNKSQRSIFIDKRNDQKIASNIVDQQLDSIIGNKYNEIELISSTDSTVRYRLRNKSAYISSVEIAINKKNWSFSQLVYKYNGEIYNDQKVVVQYSGFTLKPSFSNSDFSETLIVQKQGNDFIGTGKYKNYIVFKNFI